jgi:hypothetical protein
MHVKTPALEFFKPKYLFYFFPHDHHPQKVKPAAKRTIITITTFKRDLNEASLIPANFATIDKMVLGRGFALATAVLVPVIKVEKKN